MSDWPAALVLDEVWLRCRRTGVQVLESKGVWPASAEHFEYVRSVVAQGIELRDGVLAQALGPDAALLRGEAAFGSANRALRRRLPQVLAFGAGLGRGFAALSGADDEFVRQAADAGALFNLGVSVMDLMYDTLPTLVAALPGRLDGAALTRLAADPRAAQELARVAQAPEVGGREGEAEGEGEKEKLPAEVRVLLALVAKFYEKLHAMAGPAGLPDALVRALADAYAAEIKSTTATGGAVVARSSSLAPFLVLAEVALIADDGSARMRVLELAGAVGEVFWLIDDLVDAVADAQAGSLNALLASTGAPPAEAPAALLRGNSIEDFAKLLGTATSRVQELLSQPGWPDQAAAAELGLLTRHGVRSWME